MADGKEEECRSPFARLASRDSVDEALLKSGRLVRCLGMRRPGAARPWEWEWFGLFLSCAGFFARGGIQQRFKIALHAATGQRDEPTGWNWRLCGCI
jgi:hypothetical protein